MGQTCYVNGKKYEFADGSSITIINDKVYCNGKIVIDPDDFKEKTINITIKGDVKEVSTTCGTIEIKGNVHSVESTSGNIHIEGNVAADVSSQSGDVTCGDVLSGNVKTMSGDINCGDINGEVSTMSGDITRSMTSRVSKAFGKIFSKGEL